MDNVKNIIGTAFYDTHGKYCERVVLAGYDLNYLYNAGGPNYGDFGKVYIVLALLDGVKNYHDFLVYWNKHHIDGDFPPSKKLFTRVTGIKQVNMKDQVTYNKRYRNKTRAELDELRALNAMAWIDSHTDETRKYLDKITSVKTTKLKKTIDKL